MNDKRPAAKYSNVLFQELPFDLERQVESASERFLQALRSGQAPRIEDYLSSVPEEARPKLLLELIAEEVEQLREMGRQADRRSYEIRFPDHKEILSLVFANTPRDLEETVGVSRHRVVCDPRLHLPQAPPSMPHQVGRYLVRSFLGGGSFGIIYLAEDPVLKRLVVLKTPRMERFSSQVQVEQFLKEARFAASVKHAGIVTIFDVLQEPDGVYVVQEYVEGENLGEWLMSRRQLPNLKQVVLFLIRIAEAIGYAHRKGLIHRDLKPANVMIDGEGQPRVTDFGLAVHESEQAEHRQELAGTPAYMAPEQVRGEAHRMDGRADIWALGIMFYEMLVGRRPFYQGSDPDRKREELFDQICTRAPKPPRQINPDVPEALERICLRCLAKNPEDRYSTAVDLARDLERWLDPKPALSRRAFAASLLLLGLMGAVAAAWMLIAPHGNGTHDRSDSVASTAKGVGSEPDVINMELYVRRDQDDQKIQAYDLVIDGREQPLPQLAPLGPSDDLRLYAEFDRPAYWYLLHVDPAGYYVTVSRSAKPQKVVHFPEPDPDPDKENMAAFNPEDPRGVNTLLLIAADSPLSDIDDALRSRLGEQLSVIDELPAHWARLRAGMQERPTAAQVPHEMLGEIESKLPPGHVATHALFLSTR